VAAAEENPTLVVEESVNTKKWYRRKTDLWAELGDKYHSAGKVSLKESVRDACGRQRAIVPQRGCLRF
jgi:hypothetical protein